MLEMFIERCRISKVAIIKDRTVMHLKVFFKLALGHIPV